MSENKQIETKLGQTLQGFYKVGVVDENHNLIWEQPNWTKNLITNIGMDNAATATYASLFAVGDIGTGSRVNYVTSSDSMATVGGGSASLFAGINPDAIVSFTQSLAGYTKLCEAGDVIQFADGTIANVISSSNLSMSVYPTTSLVDPSQSFTIWKTSQTSLQFHVKYAAQSGISDSGIITGSPYTFSTVNLNTVTMQRTWDFAKETIVSRSYTEVGVRGGSGVSIGNMFSRVLLPAPIFIDIGQRLRLSYQLQVTFQPTNSISRPNLPIGGWGTGAYPEVATNTNASESIQGMGNIYSSVASDGSNTGFALLEPSAVGGVGASGDGGCGIFISRNTQSLVVFNATQPNRTVPDYAINAFTRLPYTSSNYYIINSYTWGEGEANFSDIGSMGVGFWRSNYPSTPPAENGNQAFVTVFEQTHSKANTQTLTTQWRTDWARILS